MIWLWMVLLALVAMAAVAVPMMGRAVRMDTTGDHATPAVLQDQLDEVSRDLDRGVISAEEARAARTELKRRILAIARRGTNAVYDGRGRGALWAVALLVPVLAAGFYAMLGAPNVASMAFADRAAERAEASKIADLTEKLQQRLLTDPAGGPTEGWMLLGQTYLRMGRYADAVAAFDRLTDRPDATSATFSMLAEARINLDNGIMTPAAEAAADRAIVLDPTNPAGTYYKALALGQKGQDGAAHDLLTARLDQADEFEPWMELFANEANRLGQKLGRKPVSLARFAPMMAGQGAPGPDAEDVAAAAEMSEGDRADFIRSMVARLADRLADNPDDLDGWMRLGNARRVLGETDAARTAYETAARLLAKAPENDPRQAAVKQALEALQQEE